MEQAQTPDPNHKEINHAFEIALIKTARLLYDYVKSQDDPEQLRRLDPMFTDFQDLANDYHNETGRLHGDLAFNLLEWATFKEDMLTISPEQQAENARKRNGVSGVTPRLVAEWEGYVREIIEDLEQEHGLK